MCLKPEEFTTTPAAKRARWKTSAWVVTAGLVVGMIIQQVIIFWLSSGEAVAVRQAPNYRIAVHRGDLVAVDFEADRDRECITQNTRWLWRDEPDGRRTVVPWTNALHAFGHDQKEPRAYRFMFLVPDSMPLGEWNVRTLHADYCWPWSYMLGPRIRNSPPFGVTVLARGDGQ
jgi:hypothetical protein